jgi:hypothetical protein
MAAADAARSEDVNSGPAPDASCSERLGGKVRFHRLTDFPAGITPPNKVRVYRRNDHHILQ